jgi:copper/silver efflux system protein
VAAWVGILALAGLDAETGVIMMIYLTQAWTKQLKLNPNSGNAELVEAIHEGAVKRVRPKIMTVVATMAGLLPVLWSTGAGADVMKRISAPMVGGLVTSGILELLVYPAIFYLWKSHTIKKSAV